MTKKKKRKPNPLIFNPKDPMSVECPSCGAGMFDQCWDARNVGRRKTVHRERREKLKAKLAGAAPEKLTEGAMLPVVEIRFRDEELREVEMAAELGEPPPSH